MKSILTRPFLFLAATYAGVLVSVGPAAATLYDVKFKLTKDVTVEALQFSVDYSAAGGEFDGSGGDVDCAVDVTINAIGAFNDDEATDTLSSSLIKTSGIDGPDRIVICTFDASRHLLLPPPEVQPARSEMIAQGAEVSRILGILGLFGC